MTNTLIGKHSNWQKYRNKIIFLFYYSWISVHNQLCVTESREDMLVRCNKTSIVAELEVGGTFGWKDTHSNSLLVYRNYSLLEATISWFIPVSFDTSYNCGIYLPLWRTLILKKPWSDSDPREIPVCSHCKSREVQTLPSWMLDGL